MECPHCQFEFGSVMSTPKKIRKLRKMVKEVKIKDKRRNPWECTAVCMNCGKEFPFTMGRNRKQNVVRS